jgi:Zn-dependent membrane protease YugP
MVGFLVIPSLLKIGILLFSGAVLFQVVTLPVEFNASSRAIDQLVANSLITTEERKYSKKVLDAAALTYVAAAASAILQLVRLLILSSRDD